MSDIGRIIRLLAAMLDERGKYDLRSAIDLLAQLGIDNGGYRIIAAQAMQHAIAIRECNADPVDLTYCESCSDGWPGDMVSQGPLSGIDRNAAWCCPPCWEGFTVDSEGELIYPNTSN